MDPVTHTLVGACLAESGLKRRTALAYPTLLIGVNLPDVDVLALLPGSDYGLWLRRGVTHGVLALLLLPILLALAVRLRGGSRVRTGPLLLLSFISVGTHPLLDLLNVYGVRLLMPFSGEWFYGDTLFIVDPWVWAILGAGVLLGRGVRGVTAPRWAFAALGAYVLVMGGLGVWGRHAVVETSLAMGVVVDRVMVSPVPVNPFRRRVVVEIGQTYRTGEVVFRPRPTVRLDGPVYTAHPSHPAAAAATRGPRPRRFLSWARFPYDRVSRVGDTWVVWLDDLRYAREPAGSWAAMRVEIAADAGSSRKPG